MTHDSQHLGIDPALSLQTANADSPFFVLVELYGAVELCELLLEQLQVGVDEAQLQRHCLLQLLVGRGPESGERR